MVQIISVVGLEKKNENKSREKHSRNQKPQREKSLYENYIGERVKITLLDGVTIEGILFAVRTYEVGIRQLNKALIIPKAVIRLVEYEHNP